MRDRLITLENRRRPEPASRPRLIRPGDDKLPDTDAGARPTIKRKDIIE
jgi:hypothetical protein